MYAKGSQPGVNRNQPPAVRKGSLTSSSQPTKTMTPQATPVSNPTQAPSSSTPASNEQLPSASQMLPDTIPYHTPLVMTPVSQTFGGNRRMSRVPSRPEDNPVSFDPESYNPDGSLRTVHKLPNFSQSYAQAMKARYVRCPEKPLRETELSIQEIFDKNN